MKENGQRTIRLSSRNVLLYSFQQLLEFRQERLLLCRCGSCPPGLRLSLSHIGHPFRGSLPEKAALGPQLRHLAEGLLEVLGHLIGQLRLEGRTCWKWPFPTPKILVCL